MTVWKRATGPLPPAAPGDDQKAWLAKNWHRGVIRKVLDTSIRVKWDKIKFVTEESPEDVSREAPSSLVATASRGNSAPSPPPAPPPTSPSPAVDSNGVSPSAGSDVADDVSSDSSDGSSSSDDDDPHAVHDPKVELPPKQKIARNANRYAAHCRLCLVCTC